MKIGNKLNQLRKLSGMTQEQLAVKIDVSRQTISKWESFLRFPQILSQNPQKNVFSYSLYIYPNSGVI